MSPDAALKYWHDLKDLAGANLKVHLTGGEPFGDWPALLAVLQAAQIQGMTAHEVETNASWCTDRQEAQRRCRKLDEAGLGRLPSDFVPPEGIRLVEVDAYTGMPAAELSSGALSSLRREPITLALSVEQRPNSSADLLRFMATEESLLFEPSLRAALEQQASVEAGADP